MSMPERSTTTARRGARVRPLAVAALLALGVGVAGCANYETTKPYQPGAGVQTNASGVQVRNLMVLDTDGTMQLAGSVIAAANDQLTSVTGTALKADGTAGSPLTISGTAVTLPAGQPVPLTNQHATVTGAVSGGMTKLTLNFAKAGPVTMTVPVVNAKANDIHSPTPVASSVMASSSPLPDQVSASAAASGVVASSTPS